MLKVKKTGRRKKSITELTLHNGFIESRYNLTTMEIKTLFIIASKLQRKEKGQNVVEYLKESDDETLYYTAGEIGDAIGITKDSFKHFERVCERLISTVITVKNPDNPNDWKKMSFLSTAEYKDGIIGLRPNKDMLPFYTKLTQNYTPLELSIIMGFKSNYAIRVYTLIKQYKNLKPVRVFKIDELKELLGIANAYSAMKDFKLNVLEPAKKEINKQLPGIDFDYELMKCGKSYSEIKFKFNFDNIHEEDKIDLSIHSEALACFIKLNIGRDCTHVIAPKDNKICSYCFTDLKPRY